MRPFQENAIIQKTTNFELLKIAHIFMEFETDLVYETIGRKVVCGCGPADVTK